MQIRRQSSRFSSSDRQTGPRRAAAILAEDGDEPQIDAASRAESVFAAMTALSRH